MMHLESLNIAETLPKLGQKPGLLWGVVWAHIPLEVRWDINKHMRK